MRSARTEVLPARDWEGVCVVNMWFSKPIIFFMIDDRRDYLKSEIPLNSVHCDWIFGSMTVNTESALLVHRRFFRVVTLVH